MELVLSVKNGKYHLEQIEKTEIGVVRTRTNDQEKINDILMKIRDFISVTYYPNEVKIYCGNSLHITLKNYKKNADLKLYSDLISKTSDLEKHIVQNVNLSKLKKIILTGAVLLTIGFVASSGKKKDEIDISKFEHVVSVSPYEEPNVVEDITITLDENNVVENTTIIPKEEITVLPTSTPTPPPIIDEELTYQDRLIQTNDLLASNNNFGFIPLGKKLTDYSYNKICCFLNSKDWNRFKKHGSDFGVDPYLLLSKGYVETTLEHELTLPTGSSYNGFGVGMFQHETPDIYERDIKAYNYNTGEYEVVRMNMESACDLDLNIKMAAMILQNRMHKYNNNIYLVLQSYNYGEGAIDKIIELYASDINCTPSDVINNYTDTGWMTYVLDYHQNPQKYNPNWKYKTYGDPNYVNKVLGHYIGVESININSEGVKVCTNLLTLDNTYGSKMR